MPGTCPGSRKVEPMLSSTNVHARDGAVTWAVDEQPTYLALSADATDERGGRHRVVMFATWDQLADLCELLTEQGGVARVLLSRARAAVDAMAQRDDSARATQLADAYRAGGFEEARRLMHDTGATNG